jgi:hypothetical protein
VEISCLPDVMKSCCFELRARRKPFLTILHSGQLAVRQLIQQFWSCHFRWRCHNFLQCYPPAKLMLGTK